MHHSLRRALAEFYGITLFAHAAGLDPDVLELHVVWREPLRKIAEQARQNMLVVAPELTVTDAAHFQELFSKFARSKTHNFKHMDLTSELSQENSSSVTNLALWPHVSASASSEESLFVAENIIDGHFESRWAAKAKDPQWITVDLGCPSAEVRAINIKWELAAASSFVVLCTNLSDTQDAFYNDPGPGAPIVTIVNVSGNKGPGWSRHPVSAGAVRGRYVRLVCVTRSLRWGCSVHELEIMGNFSRKCILHLNKTAEPRAVLADRQTGRIPYSCEAQKRSSGQVPPGAIECDPLAHIHLGMVRERLHRHPSRARRNPKGRYPFFWQLHFPSLLALANRFELSQGVPKSLHVASLLYCLLSEQMRSEHKQRRRQLKIFKPASIAREQANEKKVHDIKATLDMSLHNDEERAMHALRLGFLHTRGIVVKVNMTQACMYFNQSHSLGTEWWCNQELD